MVSTSCVYFNTYYNAQKYFRQAERSRAEDEKKMIERGEDPRRALRKPVHKTDNLYETAARRANKVLDEHKDSDLVDDTMFLMGRAFYWRRDYIAAARSFSDLEENFPDSEFYSEARYWRALSYEAQRQHSDAHSLYRELFSEGRRDVGSKSGYRLGEMAYEAEDYVAAAQEYKATIEAFPEAALLPDLWLRYGESLVALADSTRYGEALEAFETAQEEKPSKQTEYESRLNKGRVLDSMGMGQEALSVYEMLLKDGRFRVFEGLTRLQIGHYYRDREDVVRVLDEFEQVRDDFPKSASSAMALYHTALLYLQDLGDVERARDYLNEVRGEKRDSEAAVQAQRTLQDLGELDRLTRRILVADSLAGMQRDSVLTVRIVEDSTVFGVDSLSGLPAIEDTLLFTASSIAVADSSDSASSVETSRTYIDARYILREEDEEVLAAWFFENPSVERPDRTMEVFEDLFSLAELYRDQLAQADSALFYYGRLRERFPESIQIPLILYNMGWIHIELKRDPNGAKPFFAQLVEEFPSSEHANAAREFLGLPRRRIADEIASAEFESIEKIMIADPEATSIFVPMLDILIQDFVETPTAAKASFIAAKAVEDVDGDSLEAERRYARLAERFPDSQFAGLVRDRQESIKGGLAAKLERSLKSLGGNLRPGEKIETIAVEPDSVDSVALGRKYFGFALRAHRRGDLDGAREYYELSLNEQAKNPEALYQLGNIQWDQDYFQDALDYYRQALRQNQGFLKAHYRMFFAFLAQSREDSSNVYLRKVIKGDRGNPQIRFLIEEFPDLIKQNPEELDLGTMAELELELPKEELDMLPGELRLRELPLVRQMALPVYSANASGDSAIVLLDILVGRNGKPEEVELYYGSEPYASAAVNSAWDYVFYPAEGVDQQPDREGFEVRAWVELEMPVFSSIGFEAVGRRESVNRDVSSDSEIQIQDTLSVGLGEWGDVEVSEVLE